MKYFYTGLLIGLIVGLVITTSDYKPKEKRSHIESSIKSLNKVRENKKVWRLISLFPTDMFPTGYSAIELVKKVNFLNKNTLKLRLIESGTFSPPSNIFEDVSSGKIEAAISSPSFWGKKSPGFELLGGIPFGPEINEFLAWYKIGGGKDFYQNLYRRHNIYALVCGIIGPSFGGWFREPLKSLSDLQDKVVASYGLSANVLSRAGVRTTSLSPSNIPLAIQSKKLFGATIGTNYLINKIELFKPPGYIYFPGWHQQYNVLDLIINFKEWKNLESETRIRIEIACSANVTDSISQSEGHRFSSLKVLVDRGFTVARWPPGFLEKLKHYWQQEVISRRHRDDEFGKIWRSLEKFREDYSIWRELGYL